MLFPLKGLEILHQERRGQMNHSDGTINNRSDVTLQQQFLPQVRICYQAAYQWVSQQHVKCYFYLNKNFSFGETI